jgi:hypothetical protein
MILKRLIVLLDSNSLINLIKFEDLTPGESTDLSKHLGFNKNIKTKLD